MANREDVSERKEKIKKIVESCFHSTVQQNQESYNNWAKDYDEDVKLMEYTGPAKFIDEFAMLNLPKDAKIIDCGAGTGAVGEQLQKHGYLNIDAQDGNSEMLKVAKRKVDYKNYVVSMLGAGHTIPVDDGTYDAVLCCGSISQGLVHADAFPEMIRITKSGGIIMWLMLDIPLYAEVMPDFRDGKFEADVQRLCDSGAWTTVRGPCSIPDWYQGENGTLYIMRKL